MSDFVGTSHGGTPAEGIEEYFREHRIKAGKCIRVNGKVVWKEHLLIDENPTVTIETWADAQAGSPSSTKELL